MPRKRRTAKGRINDLAAWAPLFGHEYDYFNECDGINVDEYGRPDEAEREAAWHRLGAAFLKTWTDRQAQPWAMTG